MKARMAFYLVVEGLNEGMEPHEMVPSRLRFYKCVRFVHLRGHVEQKDRICEILSGSDAEDQIVCKLRNNQALRETLSPACNITSPL